MQLFPVSSSTDSLPTDDSSSDKNPALLYLNVYDLTTINNYLYWFGLGIYHSGIEAHGVEYGFGAHDYPASGVFEVEPKSCPGFIFRRSIPLGTTEMSRTEFRSFMEHLSNEYFGDTYHLISKNCNHFSDEVSQRLTGKSIPGWVNRLARIGSFCSCLLPESLDSTSVSRPPEDQYSEDRSHSCGSSGSGDSDKDVEDPNHHLLLTRNSDVSYLNEKPVKLARDIV